MPSFCGSNRPNAMDFVMSFDITSTSCSACPWHSARDATSDTKSSRLLNLVGDTVDLMRPGTHGQTEPSRRPSRSARVISRLGSGHRWPQAQSQTSPGKLLPVRAPVMLLTGPNDGQECFAVKNLSCICVRISPLDDQTTCASVQSISGCGSCCQT